MKIFLEFNGSGGDFEKLFQNYKTINELSGQEPRSNDVQSPGICTIRRDNYDLHVPDGSFELSGYRVFFGDDKNVSGLDGEAGCTTL